MIKIKDIIIDESEPKGYSGFAKYDPQTDSYDLKLPSPKGFSSVGSKSQDSSTLVITVNVLEPIDPDPGPVRSGDNKPPLITAYRVALDKTYEELVQLVPNSSKIVLRVMLVSEGTYQDYLATNYIMYEQELLSITSCFYTNGLRGDLELIKLSGGPVLAMSSYLISDGSLFNTNTVTVPTLTLVEELINSSVETISTEMDELQQEVDDNKPLVLKVQSMEPYQDNSGELGNMYTITLDIPFDTILQMAPKVPSIILRMPEGASNAEIIFDIKLINYLNNSLRVTCSCCDANTLALYTLNLTESLNLLHISYYKIVNDTTTTVGNSIPTVEAVTNVVNSNVNVINSNIGTINDNISSINNSISSIGGEVNQVETQISTITGNIATINNNITSLQNNKLSYLVLQVGNSDEIKQANLQVLNTISGAFFTQLGSDYGVGTYQTGTGGFIHVITAYSDDYCQISSTGEITKDSNYISPNEPYTIELESNQIGVALDDTIANKVFNAGQLVVTESTGIVTYIRTPDSTSSNVYFTNSKKDGSLTILTYTVSNKTITSSTISPGGSSSSGYYTIDASLITSSSTDSTSIDTWAGGMNNLINAITTGTPITAIAEGLGIGGGYIFILMAVYTPSGTVDDPSTIQLISLNVGQTTGYTNTVINIIGNTYTSTVSNI